MSSIGWIDGNTWLTLPMSVLTGAGGNFCAGADLAGGVSVRVVSPEAGAAVAGAMVRVVGDGDPAQKLPAARSDANRHPITDTHGSFGHHDLERGRSLGGNADAGKRDRQHHDRPSAHGGAPEP